jgi:hypothetical protein
MADIFLSYAREDRDIAAKIAAALSGRGWSVWWDPELRAGAAFDQIIETELTAARCVLVLWSPSSISSRWVRNEAAAALERNQLVSIALTASVTLPIQFKHLHTDSLAGWNGSQTDRRFEKLVRDVSHYLGGIARPTPGPAVSRVGAMRPTALQSAVGAGLGLLIAVPPLLIWFVFEGRAGAHLTKAFWVFPLIGVVIGAASAKWIEHKRGGIIGVSIGALGLAAIYVPSMVDTTEKLMWTMAGAIFWGAWGSVVTRLVKPALQPPT